ncbi:MULTISPECIES: hypothetical protein [Rhizobium]|jgi:hypothetical protein|uniref:hypothetical protein n=1 Tax=Rhizobium TaxID=379 RepID=UPI0010316BF0|nr:MULTISPECIES: hypothetical protein [Rhizobium]TBD37725.1 hypothetical protein ELH18_09840 [Rhizobium ruizarguesonis]TBD42433.1 hypothetical protein ELH19_09540 [Rhizobium ruizarguesonis]TBD58780.1 hypothetical protein ELH15_09600 [Rhizobium ruizarguesonis]TBD85066.1 hypothetical protein ELH13_09725 [Rhizobium ruizarguesonis]TBD89930.1 hypothetical protein ELH14_09965 [Rhizobium ruizarguesonis]
MTDDDLPLLDEIIAALQRLRERVADAAEPEPAPDVIDDDFAPGNLIELPVAAQRFEVSKDKLRRWCRNDGIGVLRGGRWMVSVPRLRRHIGR